MQRKCSFTFLLIVCLLSGCFFRAAAQQKTDVQQWHTLTLSFEGPQTHEQAEDNPFLHYRLNVTFQHENKTLTVPGFYAVDGKAAETSAEAGRLWQVRFSPDETGVWTYTASFRKGNNIAVSDDPNAGEGVFFDGAQGSFQVIPSDKKGSDFRGKGRLNYIGQRYWQFAGTREYFLKGGTDSPENFLAYNEFDGTYFGGKAESRSGEAATNQQLHHYQPHARDWQSGDPVWQQHKGKNIIGGINYLASQGVNSLYFLTLNIAGDGKDVWPYTGYDERYRFDCSKLEQWEVVFSHMEQKGIMMHLVTQETENETLLDAGDTGLQRKLYYRELIARFAHHLALVWNMGEENGYADFTPVAQNPDQQKSMISYIKELDPYQHPVVLHTHASPTYRYPILEKLLGFEALDGPSLQISPITDVHQETQYWIEAAEKAGKPWVVNLDEIGPANRGVVPDSDDPAHDTVRHEGLWGNLMAGGGGVEWYFGYKFPHNDLNAEDWRSRENMWKQTKIALDFFQNYLPFWEMQSADPLIDAEGAYCLAKPGEVYAVYLPRAAAVTLNLEAHPGTFSVAWYDPRSGGALQSGTVTAIQGGKKVSLGMPGNQQGQDWAVLIQKK